MISEEILSTAFNDSGSDKTTRHQYQRGYTQLLPDTLERLLEIGIANYTSDNSSLAAWSVLYPNAEIIGADIVPEKLINRNNIKSYLLDQSSEVSLNNFKDLVGGTFDVIVDDGSHYFEHVRISFVCLFDMLSPTGVYIIEDIGKADGWAQVKTQWEEFMQTVEGVTYGFIDTIPENKTDDSLMLWVKKQ